MSDAIEEEYDAEAEELENMEQNLNELLTDEGFIDGDDEEWESLISETAKKFTAFYNRKS